MPSTSKLTSKAQTTVPPAVREALGLAPGDHLTWETNGEEVTVSKAKRKGSPIDKWLGIWKDYPGMSTDEIIEDWRGPGL